MNGFPLSAEQVVRLVAAVLTELNPPKGTKLDRREDAVLLRLADAVGLPLETYKLWPRHSVPPNARGCPNTDNLGVMPYGERSADPDTEGVPTSLCGQRLVRATEDRPAAQRAKPLDIERWVSSAAAKTESTKPVAETGPRHRASPAADDPAITDARPSALPPEFTDKILLFIAKDRADSLRVRDWCRRKTRGETIARGTTIAVQVVSLAAIVVLFRKVARAPVAVRDDAGMLVGSVKRYRGEA